MAVQSIGNTDLSVSFKSKRKLKKAEAIVNLDDSQVRLLAHIKSVDKNKEKKHKNVALGLFYAMPIVDTLAKGILAGTGKPLTREVPLSNRLGSMATTAIGWAGIMTVVAIYGAMKKATISNSPELQKVEKKHPIASFLGDMGLILGGISLGTFGLAKFTKKITVKNPEAFNQAENNVENVINTIDQSKFNTKYLPKITEGFEKLATKAPWLAKVSGFALRNSLWILCGTAIYKSISYSNERNKKVEKEYKELKNEQLNAAKYLVSKSNAENNVLKKNQVELVQGLNIAIDQVKEAQQLINDYREISTKHERLNNCEGC